MSRVSKEDVYAALERVANIIISAAGEDAFISRRDIRNKITDLKGVEKRLTEIFYRFADHRDHKPGARITKKDILKTVDYAKEKLVNQYDLNQNGLSKAEIEKMSTTGKFAVQLARELKRISANGDVLSSEEIAKRLEELSKDLFFAGYGSEADYPFDVFWKEADLEHLTKASFANLLGLDTSDPAENYARFNTNNTSYYFSLIDFYEDYGWEEGTARLREMIRFMEDNLREVGIIIIGLDTFEVDPVHPVYWVGIAPNGDLIGLKTFLVWT